MRRPGGIAAFPLLIVLGSCAIAQPSAPVFAVAGPVPVAEKTPKPVATPRRGLRFVLEGTMIQGGALLGTAPAGATMLTLDGAAIPLAPDGRFLIAFDRDAKPVATLVATLGDGKTVQQPLSVSPRAWQIERLNTLPRFAQPSAVFEKLRPAELAEINAARAMRTGADGWRQPILWPVVGRISGLFGSQRIYKGEPGSYHSGVDVAKPTGTPVLAPADGVVILAADRAFTLEGNLLMIDHGMELNSAFLHLSRIDVRVGQRVRRGQLIGAIGMTGRATGPHLHWAMKWRGARIDPLLLAGPMPVAD
jgi:murein DD-endopeptidase MepM/ murein hydrolase activator NlpD